MYPFEKRETMMPTGIKFSDKTIKGFKPEAKEYTRREGQGFAIRVLPSGEKMWYFIYTFDKRKRYMHLGNYPDVSLATAREKFDIAKVKVKNGVDPLAEMENTRIERQRTPLVADFVEEYVNRYAKIHNRGWKEIERALKSEIVSRWGKRKITDIRRRDLVVILDEIADRGAPVMANRLLAYTRKMFSYAVERDVLEVNPLMGMDRPQPEKSRERALSSDEINTLWWNVDDTSMSNNVRRAIRLIVATGQRPGEVTGMHSDEVEGGWWTIPAERSKNGMAHRVYLNEIAKDIIGNKVGYIFESPSKVGFAIQEQCLTCAIKANLPHTPDSTVIDKLKIPYFIPHDLRRTAATCWGEMGIDEALIDRLQNHISKQKKGMGFIYNRYKYDKEKRAVMEEWETTLNDIIAIRKEHVSQDGADIVYSGE